MLSSPWMAVALQRFLTPSPAAAVVFALVSSLLFYRARGNYLRVPLLPRVPPGKTPPDCMVVIPARNEEGVVAGAVKSFPPDTVIVVDDHSTDKTADEAREAGAGVLEAPPLKGAVGKANACMAGARILTSRWILFADADTRYQEGFLDSLVDAAYHSEAFFVSVRLTPQSKSLTERLIEPYTEALLFSSSRLQRDPAFLFEGQCVLVLREAYEFIGGHTAIWKYLAEDLHLAMLARRHKMGIAVVRAGGLGHARNYSRLEGRLEMDGTQGVPVCPHGAADHGDHPGDGPDRRTVASAGRVALVHRSPYRSLRADACGDAATAALVRKWVGNSLRCLLAPVAVYAALPFLLHGLTAAFFKKQIVWKGRKVKPA